MQSIKNQNKEYRIIDLFAGIGGIRLGFEKAANNLNAITECVFTSEIDKYACMTYRKNFPNDTHDPQSDITLINENKDIPNFDVLLAGFPCQAFSIAGRRGGFEDIRGTLFFDIARILKVKKPAAFLLENVKGLQNHRSGKTFETILRVLRFDLGYKSAQATTLNSKDFGVPQNRERTYIVGFKEGGGGFKFPSPSGIKVKVSDILEEHPVNVRYYISTVYLDALKRHRARHEAKGHGFGYEILDLNGIANAIVIGGMGKERNLLIDKRLKDHTPETSIKGVVNKEGIRRMTPLEWERLQGFPDNFTVGVSNAQRYKQLGNAVSVPVLEAISHNIIKELKSPHPLTKEYSYQLEMSLR